MCVCVFVWVYVHIYDRIWLHKLVCGPNALSNRFYIFFLVVNGCCISFRGNKYNLGMTCVTLSASIHTSKRRCLWSIPLPDMCLVGFVFCSFCHLVSCILIVPGLRFFEQIMWVNETLSSFQIFLNVSLMTNGDVGHFICLTAKHTLLFFSRCVDVCVCFCRFCCCCCSIYTSPIFPGLFLHNVANGMFQSDIDGIH